MRRVFIGGNWKSNGDLNFIKSHMTNVINKLVFEASKCQVVISPITLHLDKVKALVSKSTGVEVSAQNVSMYPDGAYTGEVTAKQLKNFGLNWTIIGHSERRTLFGETNNVVGTKVKMALNGGLKVIACIGEKLEEREAGKTLDICLGHMSAIAKNTSDWKKMVIAYEPVWAIGTGKTATPEQAQEVHGEIRHWISKNVSPSVAKEVQIIYGGSVTETNAKDLIQKRDIDGFLVGGASLKGGFKTIVDSYVHKKLF